MTEPWLQPTTIFMPYESEIRIEGGDERNVGGSQREREDRTGK